MCVKIAAPETSFYTINLPLFLSKSLTKVGTTHEIFSKLWKPFGRKQNILDQLYFNNREMFLKKLTKTPMLESSRAEYLFKKLLQLFTRHHFSFHHNNSSNKNCNVFKIFSKQLPAGFMFQT